MANFIESFPQIIQGGMGIGVSGYPLARAVAQAGGLGVVSGTAIDTVMVRRLQLGDPDGATRRALKHFPYQRVSERILKTYFVPGGKDPSTPFKLLPLPNVTMSLARLELIVAANYVEVFLAKEGHAGPIGVNYLEKIQTPTLASLLGAILAGVDVVLMGAGIPTQIPGIITKLVNFEPAVQRINVADAARTEPLTQSLDPRALFGDPPATLKRPHFLAIVSSHVIAKVLLKKATGPVDGFVVEDHTAGGHNAPPRKSPASALRDAYGPLDAPDLEAFRAFGLPFWLAGSVGLAQKLSAALAAGAAGVQVGTAFAYCEESGIRADIKRDIVARTRARRLRVITDFQASPTGYPFKVVVKDDAGSELAELRARKRVCDLGYLRQVAAGDGEALVYRCPGEPLQAYTDKGGAAEDTVNKLCLCNQLLATVGLGQARESGDELPVLTAGEELAEIAQFVQVGADSYRARDVLAALSTSSA
jgi:nitronate monooxygenase